jgi:hypothetical protein
MHTNTSSDQGPDTRNETWVDGISTVIGMVVLIALAVFIAHEWLTYAEAKLDSIANGPAWLKKW